MNIHFFLDPLGHYTKMFADRAKILDPDCLIVNTHKSKINHDSVICFNLPGEEFWQWVAGLKNVDRVFFHYYNIHFEKLNAILKTAFPKLVSVWCFWSGDFYALPEFLNDQYFGFSRKFIPFHLKHRANPVRKSLAFIYHKWKNQISYDHKRYIKSFEKIDYFAGLFKSDYENVLAYSGAKMKYVPFAYLSIEQIVGGEINRSHTPKENIVMVGHSANLSLNHYEVLQKLREINYSSLVLIPLSYGDVNYKKKLIEATHDFKLNVKILEEFIPLEDYNKETEKVKCAIFNCSIQIAVGNIVMLLWQGVKLFIHPQSSVYVDLKKWGIILYSTDEITKLALEAGLTEQEVENNRKILLQHLSEEKVKSYCEHLFKL